MWHYISTVILISATSLLTTAKAAENVFSFVTSGFIGNISCSQKSNCNSASDMTYKGINRATGELVIIKGGKEVTYGKNKNFAGWSFTNQGHTYHITGNSNNTLSVTKGNREMLSQEYIWSSSR